MIIFKWSINIVTFSNNAYALDKANGDDYWKRTIKKEISNVLIVFEIMHEGETVLANLKKLSVYMVFDVKIDLNRKARLVTDGHKTVDPEGSTYAGVVPRESVRIALTYAALNDLKIVAADNQNSYLTAPHIM